MNDLFNFFDTSKFPPRWFCGAGWSDHPGIGWLHIFSDIAIFAAYFAIPCILIHFLRRRSDLPFRSIFLLFGAFILLCGSTHLIEAIIFWWPVYPFSGVVKLLTALVSWGTVLALVQVAPQAMAMRSPQELEREVRAREHAETELLAANRELESRVQARTADLQRAIEQLHQEREWFRATLLSIGDGVVVADAQGGVSLLNAVAQDLTGWTEADAKGKPLDSVFQIVHEKTRAAVENPALVALREGKVVNLANHTILISKSGREWPINDSAAPIRDTTGKLSGAVLVFRDESERREREAKLKLNVERLELVVNSSEVGLWYCDLPFANLDWNAKCKEHFWWPADFQVTIDKFYERLHPEDRERTRAAIENALSTSTGYDIEYRTVSDNGSIRWVRAIGRGYNDVAGIPVRFDGITIDVSERKRNEDSLREAHQYKDRFLAMLAHELRNPLAPLRTGLKILRVSPEKNETTARTREIMDRQLSALVRLVDDLLDVSRISTGKLLLRKEHVNLTSVLQNAIDACTPVIDEHGHTLVVQLPAEPIPLYVDGIRIAQVFQNILNNAAKFTDGNGQIRVRASLHEGRAVVSIRDNGSGIAAADLPRIFDMFAQFSVSADKPQGGLGIGLSLAKSLVVMHGGTIDVLSDGPGTGCEFVVSLPVQVPDAGTQTPATEPIRATKALRILVVDDNVDAADSLATFLRLSGHECREAHDATAALAAAAEFLPQLILSDIGLPQIDGYELARRIRREPWGEKILLIAVSGWGRPDDIQRAIDAGFNLHQTKPVDPEILLHRIAELTG